MAQRQHGNEETINQQASSNQQPTRGVQTVPADSSRDQKIKNEPDTERLRSEEQSVKDAGQGQEQSKGRR